MSYLQLSGQSEGPESWEKKARIKEQKIQNFELAPNAKFVLLISGPISEPTTIQTKTNKLMQQMR